MRACPHCLSVYSIDAEHCSVDGEKLGSPAVLRGKAIDAYVFDDLLGVGGTGCVYRGHTKLGVPCAIKLLFREMASDESLIERFRREAEAVTEMDHPNVVRIFGYGTTPAGTVFIAMEHLEGKTLKDILEADAPLAHARAGRIAEQMASGLGEAHRLGFVHRDLKPGRQPPQQKAGVEALLLGTMRPPSTRSSCWRPNGSLWKRSEERRV